MEYMASNERCPNCLTRVNEGANYCSHCGQKQPGLHDHSVWHLTLDAVGDFFHLDSKLFATLHPLMFIPGMLTTEYLVGRKARYFHPFKLFLFISFLYFLTTGFLGHLKKDKEVNMDEPSAGVQDTTLQNSRYGLNLQLNDAYKKAINIPDDSLRKMVMKHGLNRFVNMRFQLLRH